MRRTLNIAVAGLLFTTVFPFLICSAQAGLQEGVAAYEANNLPLAVKEFRAGAETNDADCQYNLAVLYENGHGGDVDFTQANQWYRQAAVQDDALAMGNLGMLYLRGDGVKIDKVAGVALLLHSATLDSSPESCARRNLATTRGLTSETVAAAQKLSSEMSDPKTMLVPLSHLAGGQNSVAPCAAATAPVPYCSLRS